MLTLNHTFKLLTLMLVVFVGFVTEIHASPRKGAKPVIQSEKQVKPNEQSKGDKANNEQKDVKSSEVNKTELSPKAQKELGNLVAHADKKVADILKERGGNASNLNKLETGSGERRLGEVAEKAAKGDRVAKEIIKMVKQAKQKGQRY